MLGSVGIRTHVRRLVGAYGSIRLFCDSYNYLFISKLILGIGMGRYTGLFLIVRRRKCTLFNEIWGRKIWEICLRCRRHWCGRTKVPMHAYMCRADLTVIFISKLSSEENVIFNILPTQTNIKLGNIFCYLHFYHTNVW